MQLRFVVLRRSHLVSGAPSFPCLLRGGQAAVTSSVLFELPVGLLALGGLFACVFCDRVYKVIFSKALHVRTLYVLGQEYVPVVSLAHDIANAEFLGEDSWTHR